MSGLVDDVMQVNLIDDKIIKDTVIVEDNISIAKKSELGIIATRIANTFEIKSSDGKLSNISLIKLKKIVQDYKIINLYQLSKFLNDECVITNEPHKSHIQDWLCYGDLLFNKVYSYKEAINIIKLHDLSKIDTPLKWIEYYNNLIDNEMKDKNKPVLNDLFYIPSNPKTYYLLTKFVYSKWRQNK